jgi:hypothetical protein
VRVNLARTSGALSAVDSVRICCVKFEFLEGRFTTPCGRNEVDTLLCPQQGSPEPTQEAEKRHRANFGECLLLEVEPSFRLSCGAALDRPTFEVRSCMPSLIQINAYFNEALRIANA